MSEKKTVVVPDEFRRQWDEIRICAALLRQGQARIASGRRGDGSTYQYTELKSGYQHGRKKK